MARPRIVDKYSLTPEEVAVYAALVIEGSDIVTVPGKLRLCRDGRDDMVLETALVGRAGYVVSRDDDVKGDDDLIKEMERRGVTLLSVARFLERLPKAAE